MTKLYEVNITREGGQWLADVPAVSGAHTFARSIPSLLASVREVIILMDDLDDDAEVKTVEFYELDDSELQLATELASRRKELAAAEADLLTRTNELAGSLSKRYSVRDVAAMLGISPGRVSQITNA